MTFLNDESILIKCKNLYSDNIFQSNSCGLINPYNEEAFLLYNPEGSGGILVVDRIMFDIILKLDGKQKLCKIIEAYDKKDEIIKYIEYLISKDFIKDISNLRINERKITNELSCWIHLTNSCNLSCDYCYIHKSPGNMDKQILINSVDKMIDSCIKHNYKKLTLMFAGGEPLLQFDLIKYIIDYVESLNSSLIIKYTIPSNGILISEEVAMYIKAKQILIGVSLDGIEHVNDYTRHFNNGLGSYNKIMNGINNLIKIGIRPSIMTTVSKSNIDGLLELTENMIKGNFNFRFSLERDTSSGFPSVLNNEIKLIDKLNECILYMTNELLKGNTSWYFQFGDVHFNKPVKRNCGAGKNFFSIGNNGALGSCSIGLENSTSNINEINDFIPELIALNSELAKSSVLNVLECSECNWRHSCAGGCPLQTFATYSTFDSKSPYCNIYKNVIPNVLKMYGIQIYIKNKIASSN